MIRIRHCPHCDLDIDVYVVASNIIKVLCPTGRHWIDVWWGN